MRTTRPRRTPPAHGHRRRRRCWSAGCRVDRLAARVGSTPFFAYDRAMITDARRRRARRAPRAGVASATRSRRTRCRPSSSTSRGLVDPLDVASAGEIAVALDTGHARRAISFAGPGKTDAELRQAVAAGVIGRGRVAHRAAARSCGIGKRARRCAPRVAVRVNPDFAVKGSGMRMGGGPQQFGVDAEAVPALLGEVASTDVDVDGFHVFAGSQNLQRRRSSARPRSAPSTSSSSSPSTCPAPVRYVNLGGGFGIPYFEKDEPPRPRRRRRQLSELGRRSGSRPRCRTPPVVIELGRYLVGRGRASTSPGSSTGRSRAGAAYVVVDGGMHHQLAASGNFGQVIRRNYPLAVAHRGPRRAPTGPVTVVGCLCTPLDLLGDEVDAAAAPRSATSSSCSRPAPTASRPARPRSSATRSRRRSSCDPEPASHTREHLRPTRTRPGVSSRCSPAPSASRTARTRSPVARGSSASSPSSTRSGWSSWRPPSRTASTSSSTTRTSPARCSRPSAP